MSSAECSNGQAFRGLGPIALVPTPLLVGRNLGRTMFVCTYLGLGQKEGKFRLQLPLTPHRNSLFMSKYDEKESTSCPSSRTTGQPSSRVSDPTRDLHENRLSPDPSRAPETPDSNVLIVDWDGPDDPANPKKYVLLICDVRMTTKCHHRSGTADS